MLITKTSRDTYQFSPDFFQPDGGVNFADFAAARRFASQMSTHRTQPVPASELYAMQLIDEAMRMLMQRFAPVALMNTAVSSAAESLGADSVTATQKKFVSEFPPDNVYRGEEKIEEYLARLSNGRIKTVEELIYVYTHNANPAVHPLLDLVDDEPLEPTAYKSLIASLNTFFARVASEDAGSQAGAESLFDILRAPSEASPYSLEGQLQFILDKWGQILDVKFVSRIVRGMDYLREETVRQHGHGDFKHFIINVIRAVRPVEVLKDASGRNGILAR